MSLPVTLLTLPIGGVLWIARQVAEAANAEWRDPARIERALLALERRLLAGEIDDATYEAEEATLLAELQDIRLERGP